MAEPKRTVGRPRRLTLEAIVDAACDIGIARLEMGLVAERLNTGVATLYGYIRGRDHLLELATQRLAGQSLVKDRGQSWQEIIGEHAAITFRLFESLPHLITNLMGEPDRPSLDYSHLILAMLARRGLPLPLATELYTETNQAVIGAAVCLVRRRAMAQRRQDTTGLPVQFPATFGDYRPTLERIVAGYEALLAAEPTGA